MASLEGSENAPQDTLIQSLLDASENWAVFDLKSRKSSLATNVTQTKENREAALAARKNLSEITKSFKKDVKSLESHASVVSAKAVESDEVANLLSIVAQLTKSCRSTVKSYQEEIDNLTRRCKASDTSFLDLANPMQNLSDPGSILKSASLHLDSKAGQVTNLLKGMEEMHQEMEQLKQKNEMELASLKAQHKEECLVLQKKLKEQSQESQNANNTNREDKEELIALRKEVAEYEVEFRSLKNQDITIKKLKNQIEEMTRSHEERLSSELEKLREEVQTTEGQRAAEALEREAEMERRVQSLELELKLERAGREATQTHLLEADEGANKREAVWEAQRQIILKDADRLREALHEVTREKNELSLKFENLKENNNDAEVEQSPPDGSFSSDMVDFQIERKAYEDEIHELGITVSSLKEELNAKEEALLETQSAMQAEIDKAHDEHTRMQNDIEAMSKELELAPSTQTYEEMKRELRILKKLEYNAGDIDEEDGSIPNTTDDKGDDCNDLEAVLIAKLRKAESDLLKERREKVEQVKECEGMRKHVVKLEKEKKESDDLVTRLEADLERVIESAKKEDSPILNNEKDKGFTDVPLVAQSDPSTLQKLIDPIAPPLPPAPPKPVAPSSVKTTDATNDHSVETIIMAQRDRLRARCDALEAERDGFKKELQVQVSVTEQLSLDNSKLYEKVRYLQSFNGTKNTFNRSNSKGRFNDKDLDLESLEQKYEASVDPFRQFSRSERQRKLKEMSPIERIVFIFAKTTLGNKTMRKILFFYVLSMHVLVFFTTYHISHEVACQNQIVHHDISQHMVDFDPVKADIAAAKAAVGNSH